MPSGLTTLERAFQLAASGSCEDLTHLRKVLDAEGYDLRQLEGPALRSELRELIKQASKRKASEPKP